MATRKTSPARAAASRRNGARSRGPASAAGKARSARAAVKHGLTARRATTLDDEEAAAFAALGQALHAGLLPAGALQARGSGPALGVGPGSQARWSPASPAPSGAPAGVDRLEAVLLGRHLAPAIGGNEDPDAALGAGLVRDGHGPRALETLVRYRGAVLAELVRSLGALRVLQTGSSEIEPPMLVEPRPRKPNESEEPT